jgi:eukaryotic-like serine/threonine-protein kinase
MYEMLTGRLPFQSESPQTLAMMHLREEPPPLSLYNPAIPEAMERIIRKVLAKEPSARYRTADQLGHILLSYKEQGADLTAGRPAVNKTDSQGDTPTPPGPTVPSAPSRTSTKPRPRMAPVNAAVTAAAPEEQYYGEEEEDEDGIDWLAIVLGAVALVAVLGLIPLWLFVMLQYNPGLIR